MTRKKQLQNLAKKEKNQLPYQPKQQNKTLPLERIWQREVGVNHPKSACGPTVAAMVTHYFIQQKFIEYDDIENAELVNRLYKHLELFLSISDERHPILLDQLEDNLDNRTISTQLVDFIKRKSKERQIILITNNANLVVLTDSENVIIENQDPQLHENQNHRFEYITGALECNYREEGNRLINKGIRDNTCEILEGGQEAFEFRERKYGFV